VPTSRCSVVTNPRRIAVPVGVGVFVHTDPEPQAVVFIFRNQGLIVFIEDLPQPVDTVADFRLTGAPTSLNQLFVRSFR
jgi:hypothetical protein